MNIKLNNVIPHPVKELPYKGSEIWGKGPLELERGKKYNFYAPSGKGKTTLLSIIYGIRRDFDGEVLINSKPISFFSQKKWSELRKNSLSYIFQGLELFEELTAWDNIQLKNDQLKYKQESEIIELAKRFEIDDYFNKIAGKLSFGQKQRVAILRALCQPFDFLLADEIFSHLDLTISSKITEVIIDECDKRKAGLLTTSLSESSLINYDRKFRI